MRTIPIFLLLTIPAAAAQETRDEQAVGVVCRVKVLSDKVPDVSDLDAWARSFLKPGMSDAEKALAVWRTVATFQHQENPPAEYLQQSRIVQDAIKVFNVYGYAMCSPASSHVSQLARHAGLQARGWAIHNHSVPEIFHDGAWHLYDASLICYFPKADGTIASVEEIIAAVTEWYEKNPGYKGNDQKLREFQRQDNHRGWKKGPALLARAPTLGPTGWWPAATHGWYATMQEYDGEIGGGQKPHHYEYGYSQGYEVNLRLRKGERITRNWSNKGLHVNMHDHGAPYVIKLKTGESSLRYTPEFGDLAPGRIGNGLHEYDVPLAGGAFRGGALAVENLDDRAAVQDPSRPGVLVVRMPSSYVYLTGALVLASEGEAVVSYSDNNGLDWKEIARGSGEQKIDLSPHVFRRYDYRLRVELRGAGARLTALRIAHDIQHSQRPLPALGQGTNTISFSAGPAESTITIEAATDPGATKGKQLTYKDFHPKVQGLKDPHLLVQGKGEIVFPIATPGDMVRLRFGTHYRARDKRDGWDYDVSFDGGGTWKKAGRAEGPTGGHCTYVTFADVPAGARQALVRFSGTSRNTTMIMDFRIDADYLEPAGGFRPVRVIYRWQEDGQDREQVFTARRPQETWTIACEKKPVMKSIVLELAE